MNGSRPASTTTPVAMSSTAPRRSIDLFAALAMLLFCLPIGLQQVAIKGVAEDITPLAQVALRSALAATLVGALACWRGMRFADFRDCLGPGILVGLAFTGEFVFVALGLNYTLASHISVFLYTAPVFAALGLHWLVPGEQLDRRQWLGIALAFTGMVIAISPGSSQANASNVLLGDMLGVLAGLCWAATTLILRRSSLSESPPLQTLTYQLATAGILLLPVAAFSGDLGAIKPTPLALASLSFQTLVISFGALLLWFTLLRRYWASQLGVFSFLSPIFGVLFGALLLNEPLTLPFVAGGGLLLGGLTLVSRRS